jgi:asparagine synthase (glutamine-hydrolysing)
MCGIVGWVSPDRDNFNIRSRLERMLFSQKHRGPDATGIFISRNVGIGHVRLSIIDINEEGNQPFISSNGKFAIVFNGEIYNYKDLKKKLVRKGVTFRTTSDTEVLLEAFISEGISCLSFIEGMFSFAILELATGVIFCCRDRLGEKPFYYSWSDKEGLIFASEMEAVAGVVGDIGIINENALNFFLMNGYMKSPGTLLSNIAQLEPGCYMWARPRIPPEIKSYWSIFNAAFDGKSNQQRGLVEEFNLELDKSVKNCTVSDVPFGVFLSGGIDSSSIVESIVRQKLASDKFKSYTLGYDEPTYSESLVASKTASRLGVQNEIIPYEDYINDISSIIRQAARVPIADLSFIPLSIISKAASIEFKVMLGGDGGDELLLGYDTYRATRLSNFLGSAKLNAAKKILTLMHKSKSMFSGNVTFSEKLFRFLEHRTPGNPLLSHTAWRLIFSATEANQISQLPLNQDCLTCLPEQRQDQEYFFEDESLELLTRASLIDYRSWLGDGVLRKLDASLMFNSIEGRSPFLNHKLIELGFRMELGEKSGILKGKLPLRETLKNADLSHICAQKKKGFGFPIDRLFRGKLRDFLFDEVRSGYAKNIFNMKVLDELLQQHDSNKRNHGRKLYCALILALWSSNTLNS